MPVWSRPSTQSLRNAERLADLGARLPALFTGQEEPKDPAERLTLGLGWHKHKRRYATAARCYSEAFAAQPALAQDPRTHDRYNAACAAALAGCGQGQDAGGLSDRERARLRQQALDWLKEDLRAWGQLLEAQPDQTRAAAGRLAHWLKDPDFAGVRGEQALAKLPAAERAAWQRLWKEVQALRQRAVRPLAKAADPRLAAVRDAALAKLPAEEREATRRLWADVGEAVAAAARAGGAEQAAPPGKERDTGPVRYKGRSPVTAMIPYNGGVLTAFSDCEGKPDLHRVR